MKRLKLVLVLLLSSFTLTGCIQEYTVTAEKSDAIAEYMAGVLLENDKNYDQDLVPMEDINAGDEAVDSEDTEEDESASEAADASAEDAAGEAAASDAKNTDAQEQYTLSEVVGKKNFNIQYKGYKLTETYPEDPESAYFSITPRQEYQLLVITFSVENASSTDKQFDLSKTSINYQLDINVGTIYKPQFTLLENDLRYIDMSIKGKETQEAVLVFEVSKDIDISDINLIVSNADKSEIIEIK
jgi:hypothetical protein